MPVLNILLHDLVIDVQYISLKMANLAQGYRIMKQVQLTLFQDNLRPIQL